MVRNDCNYFVARVARADWAKLFHDKGRIKISRARVNLSWTFPEIPTKTGIRVKLKRTISKLKEITKIVMINRISRNNNF